MSRKVGLEDRILSPVELICHVDGLPMPEPEVRFDPARRWRLDWGWRPYLVALEIEGGAWIRGRHTRPQGFLNDIDKYNRATALGWRIFRCTPTTVHLGMQLVANMLKREP